MIMFFDNMTNKNKEHIDYIFSINRFQFYRWLSNLSLLIARIRIRMIWI
jgi:abortive infection bacteriophage resistance protein